MARSSLNNRFRLIEAAIAVAVVLFGGCTDDSPTGPSAEDAYRIQTLQLAEPTLVAGDSTAVSARVLDGAGNPAGGVPVVFGEMLGKRSGSWAPDRAVTGRGRMGADDLHHGGGARGADHAQGHGRFGQRLRAADARGPRLERAEPDDHVPVGGVRGRRRWGGRADASVDRDAWCIDGRCGRSARST